MAIDTKSLRLAGDTVCHFWLVQQCEQTGVTHRRRIAAGGCRLGADYIPHPEMHRMIGPNSHRNRK